MDKSQDLGPITLSHSVLKEVLLKSSILGLLDPLAWHFNINPQHAVTVLENRLNNRVVLDADGRDFPGLILACLENMELRKALAEEGLTVPELSGEDFISLREAHRSQKEKSPAVLQKSQAEKVRENEARSRVLAKALELRVVGKIESLDLTKIENRLNKSMPLPEEIKSALWEVRGDVEYLEKNSRQYAQPLMKTQKDWDWDTMTPRQRAEYIVNDGKRQSLCKGENTLVRVERKDGSVRDIPLRKVREQLNSLAVSKSHEIDLPITQVNHLCNQIAKGNEAAKRRLETEYSYFLQGLFS